MSIFLPSSRSTLERIKEHTAEAWGLSVEELTRRTRAQPVAFARQVAMFIASEITHASRSEIARAMGVKDHSTAVHAINRINQAIRPPRVPGSSQAETRRQQLVQIIQTITKKVKEHEQ